MGEVGYASCSNVLQNLTAHRRLLTDLGLAADQIYLDRGLTDTSRARVGSALTTAATTA